MKRFNVFMMYDVLLYFCFCFVQTIFCKYCRFIPCIERTLVVEYLRSNTQPMCLLIFFYNVKEKEEL